MKKKLIIPVILVSMIGIGVTTLRSDVLSKVKEAAERAMAAAKKGCSCFGRGRTKHKEIKR